MSTKKRPEIERLLKMTGRVVVKAEEGQSEEQQKFYVEGYASAGSMDTYGDKISAEALKQLAELLPGAILLHNHDPDQQLGIVREARTEDETKVWTSSEVMDDEAKKKVQDGRLNAFSIHAIVSEYKVHNGKGEYWYEITAFERVVELSLTSVPVQEQAVVTGWVMKSLRSEGAGSANDRAMERFRKAEMAKSVEVLKSMATVAEFLDQVAASLRSVDTDDTVAAEAMAEIATACEEKAALLREEESATDAESEEKAESKGEDAQKAIGEDQGEGAPEPNVLELAMTEMRKSFEEQQAKVVAMSSDLDALKASVKALEAKVDGAESVAKKADEAVQKAISGVKAIEQRIEALPSGESSSGGETKKSALAGAFFKD